MRTLSRSAGRLHILLVAGVVLMCAVLLVQEALRIRSNRDELIRADLAETANLAQSLAQHTSDLIETARTALYGLRERVEKGSDNAEASERLHRVMIAQTRDSSKLNGLLLYGADGMWRTNSFPNAATGGFIGDRGYFAFHREHKDRGAIVSAPMRSRVSGSWIVITSVRVDDQDGNFAGVLVATISIDSLNAFYRTFDVGPNGVIGLFERNGTFIAGHRAQMIATGLDMSRGDIFQRFLPQSPVGSLRYMPAGGTVERLGSYRSVGELPLVMIVSHGLDDVLAEWWKDSVTRMTINLVVACAFCAAGLVFALLIRNGEQTKRQYRLLADYSSDAIVVTGLDGVRTYASPAFSELTGWSTAEALTMTFQSAVHPDDTGIVTDVLAQMRGGRKAVTRSYRYRCKSGAYVWTEARLHLLPESTTGEARLIANIRDITDRKLAERRLEAATAQLYVQATTDSLSGLANRRRFDETFAEEWDRAIRSKEPLSVMMIDVDRFKQFNDTYGHAAGDACLRAIADAAGAAVQRAGDLVARYGGEEFVILMPNTYEQGALHLAEKVRRLVQEQGVAHGGNLPLGVATVSIGVATLDPMANANSESMPALLATADAALYEAKRAGRNRVLSWRAIPTEPFPAASVDEPARLAALGRYDEAGAFDKSEQFDRLVKLTAKLFDAPIALLSLVGRHEQRFAACTGLNAAGTGRDVSFCAHAIGGSDVFVVGDAHADPRFADNPLVLGDPSIRFYAGAPLMTPEGYALGALCIIDTKARPAPEPEARALLKELAALAVSFGTTRLAAAEAVSDPEPTM